jgi:NTP pyrophosphatase (non-canonical NTP hydrolase)
MTEPTPRDRALTREEFVAAMALIAESVYDFHSRFGIPMVGAGLSPEKALEELRTRLPYLMEEVGEHARALNNDDLGDALLELADVAFVVAGSVLNMGGLAAASCREVARKNDAKTAATHYLEESSGKVLRRPPSCDLRGVSR